MDMPVPASISDLGKISYGLYLFHEFAIQLVFRDNFRWLLSHLIQEHQLVAAGFALCLTIGLAAVSYQYLERPILRYKEHFEKVRTREA
jgi:peptidoglycan/LPS O-acetylase OafA/YrhL